MLSQSGDPEARDMLAEIARGRAHPDLQRKAIQNLGLFGGRENRQALADIYAGSDDVAVKKAVLQAFMVSGEKGRVLAAARTEKVPELRREAIQQLGVMGAQAELWELYRAETDVEVKKAILHGLLHRRRRGPAAGAGAHGDAARAAARDRAQPRPARRARAPARRWSRMYRTETDRDDPPRGAERAVHPGQRRGADPDRAQREGPRAAQEAVSKLSLMGSNKAALDFMMELLK